MKKLLILLFVFGLGFRAAGQGLESYIDKPVNEKAIANAIGAADSRLGGDGCLAFQRNGSSFGVTIYSNWQKSQISVVVLTERDKNGVEIMRDFFILDFNTLRRKFPCAKLFAGMDNTYENGGLEKDNLIITIYDYSEKDSHGEEPEYYTRILKAWTIDKTKLKFIEIPTKGLTHYNDGYGL